MSDALETPAPRVQRTYGESVVIDLTDAVTPRSLLDAVPDPIVLGTSIRDEGGNVVDFRLLYLNAAARERQPHAAGHIGSSFTNVWPERWWQQPLEASLRAAESGVLQRGEVAWRSRETGLPSGYSFQAVPADNDTLMVVAHDITARLQEAHARSSSERRFETVFQASPAAVLLMGPDGSWVMVNPSLAHLLGTSMDALKGRSFADFADPEQNAPTAVIDAAMLRGVDPDGTVVTQQLRATDGRRLWTRVQLRPVPGSRQVVAHVHDVTEDRRTLEDLEHIATHDVLTGLPNRRYVLERLSQAIAARQRGVRFGVLFIDLDDFKEVNDRLGHLAGDEMLREVARRLSSAMRPMDTVARLGGDEFIVICEQLSSRPEADLLTVANRIQSRLSASLRAGDGALESVSSTIGIVVGDESYRHPDEVLRAADTAMYVGKRRGRGRQVTYDPAKDSSRRSQSERDTGGRTG